MADNSKDPKLDKDGVRLAPQPITRSSVHVLPAVYQEYVISPTLEIDERGFDKTPEPSTETDLQPKKQDVSKRWKRGRRARNFIAGFIMFIMGALVLLPYILGAVGEALDFLPFKYTLSEFGAIGNVIEAFRLTSELGWAGEPVNEIWIFAVPDLILILGLLFVLINLVKSIAGMCGSVKPKKYALNAVLYLLCVLAVFVASLVGAEAIGVGRIDFMSDFIYGFKTSELFTLLVFAAGNVIAAGACSLINPVRTGYLK